MKSLMVLLGLVVGGVIGYLTRPSLPLLGQPPLGAIFGSLNSRAQWEQQFAQQSVFHLVIALVIGAVVGLILGMIASKFTPPVSKPGNV